MLADPEIGDFQVGGGGAGVDILFYLLSQVFFFHDFYHCRRYMARRPFMLCYIRDDWC